MSQCSDNIKLCSAADSSHTACAIRPHLDTMWSRWQIRKLNWTLTCWYKRYSASMEKVRIPLHVPSVTYLIQCIRLYNSLTWCKISAIQLALCRGDWANGSKLDKCCALEHLRLPNTIQEVDCTVSIEPWRAGRVVYIHNHDDSGCSLMRRPT